MLQQLLRQEGLPPAGGRAPLFSQIAALRMHQIEADTGWAFLTRLRHIGYAAAQAWLAAHFTHLGRRSTLALDPYLT